MGTQRTKSQIDALYADNEIGSITPARLRDLVETLLPSKAGLHFLDPAAPTPIVTPGVFVKAVNTSEIDAAHRFSMSADNRLRYDGAAEVSILIVASLSLTCGSNNQIAAVAIAKNGAVQSNSITRSKLAIGNDIQAIPLISDGTLVANDYFEIWLTNYTSTAPITIERCHVRVFSFMN